MEITTATMRRREGGGRQMSDEHILYHISFRYSFAQPELKTMHVENMHKENVKKIL